MHSQYHHRCKVSSKQAKPIRKQREKAKMAANPKIANFSRKLVQTSFTAFLRINKPLLGTNKSSKTIKTVP